MILEAYIVNSFTEELAAGNPAGVVICDGTLPDDLLGKIAADIGKSETAFIMGRRDGAYSIRWFSPRKEMPLCGHATLAAAKVLFERDRLSHVVFVSSTDELPAEKRENGSVWMDFPLDEYDHAEIDAAYYGFFPGITIDGCIVGRRTGKVVLLAPEGMDLASIAPEYGLMERSGGVFEKGIGISKPSRRHDFESRYFNPWAGVNEDPVTGSVHTVLARYWGGKLGKDRMLAAQVSHRPGVLELELEGERVRIGGKARIVLCGTITIP